MPNAALAQPANHPFDCRLNQVLDEKGFDAYVEGVCAEFYAEQPGRSSRPPPLR